MKKTLLFIAIALLLPACGQKNFAIPVSDVENSEQGGKKEFANIAEAAMDGDIGAVKLFLARGVNPDAASKDGLTALHYAAKNGDLQLAEIIIENGMDINAPTGDRFVFQDGKVIIIQSGSFGSENRLGLTPLHMAVRSGHVEIAQLLIDAGCHINPKDNWLKTPLDYAKTQEMKELLRRYRALSGKELKIDKDEQTEGK